MFKGKLLLAALRKWGFSTGLVALFLIATAVVFCTMEFRSFMQWVAHTNQVLGALDRIEILVERAEGSQRGYLITKKSRMLQPYHSALEHVEDDLSELEVLIKDNPVQSERAKRLREIIGHRFSRLQRTLSLSEKVPLSEIVSNLDTEMIVEIRGLVREMTVEENLLLKKREAISDFYARLTVILLLGGGALATGILIFSSYLSRMSARELKAHANLIESILSNLNEGLIVIDKDMQIIHHNRAAEQMLEIELMGISLREMYEGIQALNPVSNQRHSYKEAALYHAIQGQRVERFEVKVGKGGHRLLNVESRPVVDDKGNTIAALAVFSDITKRRETEEEWIAAREAAIEASRLKSEFLANMSHEIRTPMSGVLGMSTLLLESRLDADQTSYAKAIKTSAEGLLSLINQLLDHAKIESGKLELHEADFGLSETIENVMSPFIYLGRQKKIDLRWEVESDVPPYLLGDVSRIRQMLVNLIGNAVKFTEKGYVAVKVEKVSADDGKVLLRFSVQDTGPGIATHLQKKLFEKFSQVHDAKFTGGSGLGLMITKQLAQAMGGEVGMESVPGFGSLFWFTVNLRPGQAIEFNELKSSRTQQKLNGHVLVAEDQPINQVVIRKFLENFGITCQVVEDGGAAIFAVKQRHFDLVLMDCQMAPVDGYKATEEIRKFKTKEELPILALTAEGVSGDRKRCLDAGMDEVLNKPIDIDHLYVRLNQYLKPKESAFDLEFDNVQLEKLSDYSAGQRPLIEVLAEDFYTQGWDLIEHIRRALQSGETENMRDFAHALKSPSATLGLKALAKACAELEEKTFTEPEQQSKLQEIEKYFNNGCAWLKSRQRACKAS